VLLGVSGAGSITTVGAVAGATTVTPTGSNDTGTSGGTTLTASQIPLLTGKLFSSGGAGSYNAAYAGGASQSNPVITTTAIASGNYVETVTTNASGGSHTHTTPAPTFTGSASSVLQKSTGVYWYITI